LVAWLRAQGVAAERVPVASPRSVSGADVIRNHCACALRRCLFELQARALRSGGRHGGGAGPHALAGHPACSSTQLLPCCCRRRFSSLSRPAARFAAREALWPAPARSGALSSSRSLSPTMRKGRLVFDYIIIAGNRYQPSNIWKGRACCREWWRVRGQLDPTGPRVGCTC
jgi:hypothetical protein